MSVQAITFEQMMQSPFILRVVNRIQTPLSLFQQFLGITTGAEGGMGATQSVRGRDAGYDIFDATRQFSGARAPQTGPRRVRKKVIGHQSVQLMRSFESIDILDEDVYKSRPLGGQIGTQNVDVRGQNHIRRQITFMTQRVRNQREWMTSRMFRGGFNIKSDGGDNFDLIEYNSAATDSIPINYQVPAEHLTGLDMGTGTDIMDDWSQAASDIIGQCYKINAAMTRIHGRPLKHIWLNSNTFLNVQNNTGVQNIGGDAFTVFNSLDRRSGKSLEGIPDAGFDVVFRAMPLWTFHVYDGVLSSDGKTDGIAVADTSKLIPDDRAIFLPDPSDEWAGLIEGSEVVRQNVMASGSEATGFYSWATPMIDPPGQELKFLDNYLPVLYQPRCVAYGDTST